MVACLLPPVKQVLEVPVFYRGGPGSSWWGGQTSLPVPWTPSSCLQPDPKYLWCVAPADRTRALWCLREMHSKSK